MKKWISSFLAIFLGLVIAGCASSGPNQSKEINVYTADLDVQDESTGSIRFFSDGSSTGGWVKLTYGEKMWKISVNWLTGEITMLEGT